MKSRTTTTATRLVEIMQAAAPAKIALGHHAKRRDWRTPLRKDFARMIPESSRSRPELPNSWVILMMLYVK